MNGAIRMGWRRRRSLVLATGVALLLAQRGFADNIEWQGGVGNWFTPSNWSDQTNKLDQVPGDADFASIDNGGEAQIVSGSAIAEYLQVDGGEISLSGGTVTANGSSGSVGEAIGVSGVSEFTQSGGINTSTTVILGYNSGSSGTYDLSTGTLMVTNINSSTASEVVGYSGNGTFVQSGGNHTVNDLTLGYSSGANGTYTLSGIGLLSVGEEVVGYGGTGLFNQSGGTNSVGSNSLYLAVTTGSTATYNLSNTGSLSVSGDEYVGYGGTGIFNQSGGTLSIADVLSVGTGSTATISGGMSTAGSVSNSGNLSIGNSCSLVINGSFTQAGGITTVSGILTVNSNSISITAGAVDLSDGQLFVNFGSSADPISAIQGYVRAGYDNGAWNGTGIISSSAASHSGFGLGYADGNIDRGTLAKANQILIEYALIGDANLDGTVNLTDLLALLNNYGASGRDWAEGDFNYDGTVNLTDLLALLNNYGQSATVADFASTASRATAVPEPATRGLILLGATNLLTRRRRRY